ncbi:MAG: hypothetical protein IPO18_20325 [bacterium]|nr:hypothetical protein [bacterium]
MPGHSIEVDYGDQSLTVFTQLRSTASRAAPGSGGRPGTRRSATPSR